MNEDEMLKNDFTSILSIDLIGSNPQAHRFSFQSFEFFTFVYLRSEFEMCNALWETPGLTVWIQNDGKEIFNKKSLHCTPKGSENIHFQLVTAESCGCPSSCFFVFACSVVQSTIILETYTCVKSMPKSQDVFPFKDINFMDFCYFSVFSFCLV